MEFDVPFPIKPHLLGANLKFNLFRLITKVVNTYNLQSLCTQSVQRHSELGWNYGPLINDIT